MNQAEFGSHNARMYLAAMALFRGNINRNRITSTHNGIQLNLLFGTER
jgi:hypothetical protein